MTPQTAAKQAEQAFQQAEKKARENPTDPEAAWQFGRACYDWAEFAASASQRRTIAEQGIAACRRAVQEHPKLAPAHYYLAMDLGQLAQTERLGALKLIHEMDAEFKTVAELDPKFDYAGAYRSLGLLYRDAPGWPTSIGNRHKARDYLQKAVEVAPDYPENWLSLLESYLSWGDKEKVASQLGTAEGKLQAARQQLAGPNWEWAWQDWDRRWQKIKSRAAAKAIESPRGGNR